MATIERIKIDLPKAKCPVCKVELYARDMESHMQIAHSTRNAITPGIPVKLPKVNRKLDAARKKWSAHKWKHRAAIEGNKGAQLPGSITLPALQLDVKIQGIGNAGEFEACRVESVRIAGLVKKWKLLAKKPKEEISPLVILEQGRGILRQVRGAVITNPDSALFLQSVMGSNGFLKRAQSYTPMLKTAVQKKEHTNNLELIEKIAKEKIASAQAPPPKSVPKYTPPPRQDIKQQYTDLLDKNIVPIIEHLEKERQKYITSIHKYLESNTTSVFSYTFSESKAEITGSIKGMEIKKTVPFKPTP